MPNKINSSLDFQSVAAILNLPAPAANGSPARLADLNTLEAAIAGFAFVPVVARAASTSGVGGNINIAAPGATLDGVTLTSGTDIVLLTAQTTASQNGLWLFNGAAAPLTRANDQTGQQITYKAGSVVVVGPDGASNGKTLWLQTTDNPVVGTTSLTFSQFGTTIIAGTGLSLAGQTLSLSSPVALSNGGTGQTTAAGARSALGASGVYQYTTSASAASYTITHGLNNAYPTVACWNTSTGLQEQCTVQSTGVNSLVVSSEAWTASPPASGLYQFVIVG
jgi:hypothetical protein